MCADKLADIEIEKLISADNRSSEKSWRDGLVTAAELQKKPFKPVRIILPELIPEGVTILAGKPKMGKSWFALDVCMAVADPSRFVLGDKRPIHGDVLYLALEDNQRRLKKRIDKIAQTQARWSERLQIHTEWKRVDQGGLEDIESWCGSVKEPRLIWIDTLPKIRPLGGGRNETAYAADYRAIEGAQRLAGQYPGLGIAFNCHLRKAASDEDPFDDVSGTLGLTGAADTIIVMKRHSGMMKVFVRGRDIEEAELAAEFNRVTCRWRVIGGADDVFRSKERQAILAALKEAGTPLSVSQIMAATERTTRHGLDALLYKMRQAGEVVPVGRGLYALPGGDSLKAVEICEIGASAIDPEPEAIDDTSLLAPEESQRQSQRNLNGADSVEIPGEIPEAPKPLAYHGNPNESQHLNNLNGIEYTAPLDDGLGLPACLDRSKGNEPHRWVSPDRRPALGPQGDSLDDFK